MVIFNSYVKLPEGKPKLGELHWDFHVPLPKSPWYPYRNQVGPPAFGQRRASRCIEARDQNEDRSKEAEDDVDQVQTHGELLRMIKSLFNILGQSFFNGFFYGVL